MPKSKYLQYVIFCGFLQLFSYVIFLRQHIDQWVGNLPLIYCLFCYRAWDEPRFWWSISWYNKCISGAKMSFTWFRSCAEVRRLRINLRFAPDVNGALLPSLPSIFPSLLSDHLVGLWLMLILSPGHAASVHIFGHNYNRYVSSTLNGALRRLVPLKSLKLLVSHFCTWENFPNYFLKNMPADEYILPKIAERELRRFSNLRSTSSDLGIKPSLNEVQVLLAECISHFLNWSFYIYFSSLIIYLADSSTMPCIGNCEAAKSSW